MGDRKQPTPVPNDQVKPDPPPAPPRATPSARETLLAQTLQETERALATARADGVGTPRWLAFPKGAACRAVTAEREQREDRIIQGWRALLDERDARIADLTEQLRIVRAHYDQAFERAFQAQEERDEALRQVLADQEVVVKAGAAVEEIKRERDRWVTEHNAVVRRFAEAESARLVAERERGEAQRQLTELKRGLVNNNTDFQLAFLDAYLDQFKGLCAELDACLALLREYVDSHSQCREAKRHRICLTHGWEWPCLIHRMRALLAAHGEPRKETR